MNTRRMLNAAVAVALGAIGGGARAAVPPPNGGTIAIAPKTADGDDGAATQAFVEAATEALSDRGFTILDDPDHAAYVAELILSRGDVGTALARPSGQRAASVVGAGVAIPLSPGRSELVPLRRTRLEIRIRRRGEADIVWDGAAVTARQAGSGKGADKAVASDLAQAILRAYPVAPSDVIGVP